MNQYKAFAQRRHIGKRVAGVVIGVLAGAAIAAPFGLLLGVAYGALHGILNDALGATLGYGLYWMACGAAAGGILGGFVRIIDPAEAREEGQEAVRAAARTNSPPYTFPVQETSPLPVPLGMTGALANRLTYNGKTLP